MFGKQIFTLNDLDFYLFDDVADAGVVEVVDRCPRDVLLQIVFLFLF